MNELITNLTPLFISGLAVQQLVELPDAVLSAIPMYTKYKKGIIRIVSLAAGMILAWAGQFHVLALAGNKDFNPTLDMVVAGLIVSGGTESFNSIVKFLGYAKDEKAPSAAPEKAKAAAAAQMRMAS